MAQYGKKMQNPELGSKHAEAVLCQSGILMWFIRLVLFQVNPSDLTLLPNADLVSERIQPSSGIYCLQRT